MTGTTAKATRALSESLQPTTGSTSSPIGDAGVRSLASVSTSAQNVTWCDVKLESNALVPPGFADVDQLIAERERDPERRLRMAAARKRLAAKLEGEVSGIARLRLEKGWSQKRLADEIGTSQPHIARIEAGRDNILLETAKRLSAALGVSLEEVDRVLGERP